LVYLLVLLIPNSYKIFFREFYFLPFSVHPQINTILFPSNLCTSPNQHNSIFFHSLYIPKPTQLYFLPFSVHPQTNTILFPSNLCTSPNQHNLYNLIVSVMVDFLTTAKFLY
jgi:hypothetical protein